MGQEIIYRPISDDHGLPPQGDDVINPLDYKYTGEELEKLAEESLNEIQKHTTLCFNDNDENIFLQGFNAGVNYKMMDILIENKIKTAKIQLLEELILTHQIFSDASSMTLGYKYLTKKLIELKNNEHHQ